MVGVWHSPVPLLHSCRGEVKKAMEIMTRSCRRCCSSPDGLYDASGFYSFHRKGRGPGAAAIVYNHVGFRRGEGDVVLGFGRIANVAGFERGGDAKGFGRVPFSVDEGSKA